MSGNDYLTISVQKSKVLMRPDGRAAILLTGAYPTKEPCSVAFEVNLQNIQVLRDDLAKAEAFLSQKSGNA